MYCRGPRTFGPGAFPLLHQMLHAPDVGDGEGDLEGGAELEAGALAFGWLSVPGEFWNTKEAKSVSIIPGDVDAQGEKCELCGLFSLKGMLICDTCGRGFHNYCFDDELDLARLPKIWLCHGCEDKRDELATFETITTKEATERLVLDRTNQVSKLRRDYRKLAVRIQGVSTLWEQLMYTPAGTHNFTDRVDVTKERLLHLCGRRKDQATLAAKAAIKDIEDRTPETPLMRAFSILCPRYYANPDLQDEMLENDFARHVEVLLLQYGVERTMVFEGEKITVSPSWTPGS